MRDFLKFLLSFLPWIAFGVLAGPPLIRLEGAIAFCLVLTLVMGYTELKKGYVLTWGTLLFFAATLVFVALFKNVWVMTHLDLLAPFTLLAVAWISLAIGRPFVLQIAKASVPKEKWEDPGFIYGCRYMTIFWGFMFLISFISSFAKHYHAGWPEWVYHSLSIGSVLFGMAYTEWYKKTRRSA